MPLEDLRQAVEQFGQLRRPDRSYAVFCQATDPEVDLAIEAHRRALHRWLNAWGCRIRYARSGEVDYFDQAVTAWWGGEAVALGEVQETLAALTDEHVQWLAAAFEQLSGSTVAYDKRGVCRTMGPTAAAKTLYAILPQAVMPWDDAITQHLHGARDRTAFGRHQVLGRQWASGLLRATGLSEANLAAELGRPGCSIAKILDEYCYVRYSLGM